MSDTPYEQLLEEPLEKLLPELKNVREHMMQRLLDPKRWTEEHRTELRHWVNAITALEIDLAVLAKGTR